MMGDWNAKVGKTERKNYHRGIHGLGEQNERGVKLAEFCISNIRVYMPFPPFGQPFSYELNATCDCVDRNLFKHLHNVINVSCTEACLT